MGSRQKAADRPGWSGNAGNVVADADDFVDAAGQYPVAFSRRCEGHVRLGSFGRIGDLGVRSLWRPLWQIPLTGGAPVKLADGAISTAFDVVDGGVYFLERVQQETRLRYVDLATRKSTLVAANLGNVSFGLAASRDGRTILFGRVDSSVDDLMVVENFR